MKYKDEQNLEKLIFSYQQRFKDRYKKIIEEGETFIEKHGGFGFNYLTHVIRGYIFGYFSGMHHPFAYRLNRDENCTFQIVEQTAEQVQHQYEEDRKFLDKYFELVDNFPEFRTSQLATPPNPFITYKELGIENSLDARKKWVTAVAERLKSGNDTSKNQ